MIRKESRVEMIKPIYFSKIEFCESIGYDNVSSIMLLNLSEKTLSYQKFDRKKQMPVIQEIESEKCGDEIFSYVIQLSNEQIAMLLPYCNALDFEPYRDKEMSMDDEGYIGCRDEVQMSFTAITNSYIPKIELPMSYYYDEAHIWSSERLYRYLFKTYFENNKDLKKWNLTYGESSLLF